LKLIDNLLDLSQLQAGKMKYLKDNWSIKSVLNDMKSEFSILGEEKNLSWQIEDIEETTISFDIDKIKQVIANLFSNSIRYSTENSVIEVSFEDTSDNRTVIIKNEGVPIPTDELESIFQPFIQSSKTKTGAGGTGLGLPICRKIIEDHGGKIWAEDNPNGATFKFQLPKNPT
jgi:signal transduction histidine kinase